MTDRGSVGFVLGTAGVCFCLLGGCAADGVIDEAPHTSSASQSSGEADFAEIRDALLDLASRDREARGAWVASMQDAQYNDDGSFNMSGESREAMRAVEAIDRESTAYLKSVVAIHGWPSYSMVGQKAADDAWLLAQHADDDPDFHAEVLALMAPMVEEGEASGRLLALLTDRVLTGQGKPQRYGTQFADGPGGVMRPLATEDWERVDERRAAGGLGPIAEYAKQLGESYGQGVSTEPLPLAIER